MGFGYGQTTFWNLEAYNAEGARVRKTYDASMVAHIWNAQSQTFARTSNGNFAFRGATVYSYGTGWIVAHLFNGAALVNGQKVSVTTSGHESDARGACRNRVRFELPEITSGFASWLGQIESAMKAKRKGEAQARARRGFKLAEYAAALATRKNQPGEYSRTRDARHGEGEPLGEFIAAFVGLKASEYHNAAARLDKVAQREQEARERQERARFIAESKRLADMPDSDFRESISSALRDSYSRHVAERLAKALRAARLKAGLSETRRRKLWKREQRARAVMADYSRLHDIARRRSRLASLVRYVRDLSRLSSHRPGQPLGQWSSHTWRTHSNNLAELAWCKMLAADTRRRLESLAEACKAEMRKAEVREAEERRREFEEREAFLAEKRAAWLAGENVTLPRGQWSRDDGTPHLRVFGDELQTSWGAAVPLAHAVKAFRFVKLCRERGEGWNRNGRTIRVGHFQIDRVDPDGGFVAGCHTFAWPEVERVARAAGVFDLAADESAVESKESA